MAQGGVIGICGGTCVGKTTVAGAIGRLLGWDHRDCGRAVVEEARARGLAVSDLGMETHQEVDRLTRARAVAEVRNVVVDGRYLRYVLAGLTGVTVVELTCDRRERERRCRCRSGIGPGEARGVVEESDRVDKELCTELYGLRGREADYSIDTTESTGEAVARRILRELGMA